MYRMQCKKYESRIVLSILLWSKMMVSMCRLLCYCFVPRGCNHFNTSAHRSLLSHLFIYRIFDTTNLYRITNANCTSSVILVSKEESSASSCIYAYMRCLYDIVICFKSSSRLKDKSMISQISQIKEALLVKGYQTHNWRQ